MKGAESSVSVLWEDDYVLALAKPAWAVVHPTRGAAGALVMLHWAADHLNGPVFPVHRLDRQTSGVILFAKSADVARTLGAEFSEGRAQKTYLGLCRGVVRETLRVDHPVKEGGVARPACTDFEPLEVFCERFTLLRAYPFSGRRHQIRYHLKHASHPLAGDTKYGKGDVNRFFRQSASLDRLFLHAERLRVVHPVDPRLLELTCLLPRELEQCLAVLRDHRGPTP